MFHKVIVATAVVAALAWAAAPALAAGGPVNVTATVNSQSFSISLTGLNPSFSFPPGDPGTQVAAMNVENYNVSTNDPAGMTLTINPGSSSFGPVDNSTLAVQELGTAPNGPGNAFPGGATPLLVDQEPGPGTWNYAENWYFNIPAGTPAGTYGEPFTYLAVAN